MGDLYSAPSATEKGRHYARDGVGWGWWVLYAGSLDEMPAEYMPHNVRAERRVGTSIR